MTSKSKYLFGFLVLVCLCFLCISHIATVNFAVAEENEPEESEGCLEDEYECPEGNPNLCCKRDGEVCYPTGTRDNPGDPVCGPWNCADNGGQPCGSNPESCCGVGQSCSVDDNGAGSCDSPCGDGFPCPAAPNCCTSDQICVQNGSGQRSCEDPPPMERCEGRDPPHLPCGERCCPVGVNCQPDITAGGKRGVCCNPGWSFNQETQRCEPDEICRAADNNEEYGCGEGTSCCGGTAQPANCCDDGEQTCCGETGACCPSGQECCPDGSCAESSSECPGGQDPTPPPNEPTATPSSGRGAD